MTTFPTVSKTGSGREKLLRSIRLAYQAAMDLQIAMMDAAPSRDDYPDEATYLAARGEHEERYAAVSAVKRAYREIHRHLESGTC